MIWFWLAFLSALLNAAKDIVAKRFIQTNHLSPQSIVFQRDGLMVFLMLLTFPFISFLIEPIEYGLIFLKSIFAVIGVNIFYQLLKKYEISLVTPMMSLSPVALLILSTFILNEELTNWQLAGILLIVISAYLIEFLSHEHHKKKQYHNKMRRIQFYGLIIILLFFFSATATIDKILVSTISVPTNLFFTSLFVFFFMILYGVFSKKISLFISDIKTNPKSLIIAFLDNISVFFVVASMAVPGALVSLIIPIRRLSIVFSSLFGGLLFHEKKLFQKMCCIIIIIIGTMLIVL